MDKAKLSFMDTWKYQFMRLEMEDVTWKGISHFVPSHFMPDHFVPAISCPAILCLSHFMPVPIRAQLSHFVPVPFCAQAILGRSQFRAHPISDPSRFGPIPFPYRALLILYIWKKTQFMPIPFRARASSFPTGPFRARPISCPSHFVPIPFRAGAISYLNATELWTNIGANFNERWVLAPAGLSARERRFGLVKLG